MGLPMEVLVAEFKERIGERPQQYFTTNCCDAWWTGSLTCHCGAGCHQTFSSLEAFDWHRHYGKCTPAGTVRTTDKRRQVLVDADRAFPCLRLETL